MQFDWHKLVARFVPAAWQPSNTFTQNLLSADDLLSLQRYAASSSTASLTAMREVQHPILGEKDSAFAGSGYEFAEHRQYINGDPVKHINWRVYARTGQLVRKVFHEQRRPQCYLLVDRRAPMRFGTRNQLKVTCAVKHALLNLYQAQALQLHIGAVILDKQADWLHAKQGPHNNHIIIDKLIAPCPPLFDPEQQSSYSLIDILDLLSVQLSAGSLLLIFSDFLDYTTEMNSRLHQLGQKHTVIAHHIIDPAETELPAPGHYLIQDPGSDNALELDCEGQQRKDYQHSLQQHIDRIGTGMRAAQIQYHRITTDEEII